MTINYCKAQALVPADSLGTAPQKEEEGVIDSPVHYTARDSMRFDVEDQKVYLFGSADVTYEDLNLKAGYMELDMKQNRVYAAGLKDSLGKERELPVFKQGSQAFSSQKMVYNFQTKKGRIIEVDTKEGDGYIHGETVKKDSNSVYYIKNGRYTTCDEAHPHFYIAANKLKVIPQDKIVTGPAYLVISDVPTPLVVPFGLFPNKQGRTSGVLMPTYGDSRNQGFFLRDGGVYLGFSDYFDMSLRGDIYSYGSWGLKTAAGYNKRYKFRGNVNAGYSNFFTGDKELPGTELKKDFFVTWKHFQDPKAKPGSRFEADVNAGSGSYNRRNSYVTEEYLTNTLQSNVSYVKSFTGTPFNFSLNGRHSQTTTYTPTDTTTIVDISLPEATFTMNRIYPFKNKSHIQAKWYDKIGLSYTGNIANKVSTDDSLLFTKAVFKKIQNGMIHTVPMNVSLNVLRYFTFTPGVNATSRWYLQTVKKRFDADSNRVFTDTVQGFKTANDYNLSAALVTNMYGNFYFKRIQVKQIRHVMTPFMSFVYRPDYGESGFGYYKNVQKTDTGGVEKYPIFQNGTPASGKSSLLNMSLTNNLEMKLRQYGDTGETEKKVALIDAFTMASSYNMALDSMRWSNLSMNARTKLFKAMDVILNGSLDPYVKNSKGIRLGKYEWEENKRLGRITSADLTLGTSIKSKQDDPKKKDDKKAKSVNPDSVYKKFHIPYSVSFSYKIIYVEATPERSSTTKNKNITQSLSFSGNMDVTENWKMTFNSGYDFISKKLTFTSMSLTRDLHCWEMKLDIIPFGPRQSFNIAIKVKSPVLQDLKINRKRDWYDYQ